ncbi:hypothetical protein crov175 [Cafeteria roenbergensis virus]|uniref:Uncharacterized protein n=1 Tax=Cafeteria roenbergensis virus (strain BV-PW1) TaxID=693272 RepID=E3T4U5_CROVB|nr:hypothetical protein crov175 [Cafeteria roenbergensis virus BV-PW1]ADO67208.1 hypothetical protein crov175 [Cafeteria roenbergensis virus BV-PW1]
MASVIADLFKTLSQVFNPDKLQFEDIPEAQLQKLQKLNSTLGNLYYVTKQKQMVLFNSLHAPIGVLVGGALIHVGGGDAPPLRRTQSASSTPKITSPELKRPSSTLKSTPPFENPPTMVAPPLDELKGLQFTAPDKPVKSLYSVSTVLANILKTHEEDLIKTFSTSQLQEIANLIKKTYKSEQEVYKTVFMMNEIQEQLATGNIDDKSVGTLKELVIQGRKAHKLQTEETKQTFNKIGNLLILTGLPMNSVSYL